MYGFGDTPTQAPDTLDLVEELVIEYIMMTVRSFLTMLCC